ncbi:MAG: hypothetical protein V7647_2617 [Acidobacteriota bacterium]
MKRVSGWRVLPCIAALSLATNAAAFTAPPQRTAARWLPS